MEKAKMKKFGYNVAIIGPWIAIAAFFAVGWFQQFKVRTRQEGYFLAVSEVRNSIMKDGKITVPMDDKGTVKTLVLESTPETKEEIAVKSK